MGRELQKKKRRSGRPAVRPKKPNKVLNPRGNSIVAKNWNKKETLSQNYRRLGLVARLRGATGGTEKKLTDAAADTSAAAAAAGHDSLAIASVERAIVSEAKVERDAAGRIVRVLGRRGDNPLNDLLASDSDGDSDDGHGAHGLQHEWGGIVEAGPAPTDVVRSLIEQSRKPAPRKSRHQSDGERQWLERLVAKHGDDTAAMARDARLNPMQQTAADIANRIKKMRRSA